MKHAQLEVICMRAVQETQKNVFLINKAKLAVQQADKASKIRYKQLFICILGFLVDPPPAQPPPPASRYDI